jgi:cell division protein FtsQ
MRERRIAETRARGRRRLRFVVAAVAVVVALLGAWLVVHSPLLDVDHVAVTGTGRSSPAAVRDAADAGGEPIVLLDLGQVEARVERLPWIDEAVAERELPGDLTIAVTERVPAGWIRRSSSSVALVDATGRVLGDGEDPPGELPEVRGIAVVPAPGGAVAPAAGIRVLGALPPGLAGEVVRLVVAGGEVTLVRRAGPEVRLGPPRAVGEKVRAAVAVLAALPDPPPAFVDVRAPSAPVTG